MILLKRSRTSSPFEHRTSVTLFIVVWVCSVTTAEVIDAIAQQTGRTLNKKDVELPEIKSVGSFDASIKLHPEVIGTFKVVVQREKNVN